MVFIWFQVDDVVDFVKNSGLQYSNLIVIHILYDKYLKMPNFNLMGSFFQSCPGNYGLVVYIFIVFNFMTLSDFIYNSDVFKFESH